MQTKKYIHKLLTLHAVLFVTFIFLFFGCKKDDSVNIAIGEYYQGGIIVYIFSSGEPGFVFGQNHGLIVAPTDQSTGIQWDNGSFITTGATGTAFGTGQANTTAIVTAQGAGSYAAKLCDDLVLGGYSDWYLPSYDELDKMRTNFVVRGINDITGFAASNYWSSSELNNSVAWRRTFGNGTQSDMALKNATHYVRAVRTF